MDRTLVKYPTRSRPQLALAQIASYLVDPSVDELILTLDRDDATMANPAMLDRLYAMERVTVRVGSSRTKVEAINDGVAEASWSFAILASDDMIPQRPDYASYLRSILFDKFPDGDGVLHVNDGRVGRQLNTSVVLGRKWYDRFGYLYREPDSDGRDGYFTVACDDELMAVSRKLGRAHYVEEVVIKHDWIGDGKRDELCLRNEGADLYAHDRAVYASRRAAGFPTERGGA